MNTEITSKISNALAHTVEILAAEFTRQFVASYDRFVDELAADGFDAQKGFAYPSSSKFPSRDKYRQQQARYSYCAKWTHSTAFSRRHNDPNPVVLNHPRDEVVAILANDARKLAEESVVEYTGKLAGKIIAALADGETVNTVTYRGGIDVWSHSHIEVTTSLGKQVWRTRMIINCSVYGTLFNQWPTRRVD